jgi:DNA-binding transcriptional LysR family regulator
MQNSTLDLDLLRTLVYAVQSGSFKQAASIVGRTQSAVSLQMNRLESSVGVPVFERAGKGMSLTASGAVLFDYARRMLELNDEAIQAASGMSVRGRVSLGLQQDFAETVLPSVLATFSRAHRSVEIDVQVERSSDLLKGLRSKRLDLVLMFWMGEIQEEFSATVIGKRPMKWIVHPNFETEETLRLVLFAPPCAFRDVATRILERKSWKQTFSSASLSGTWAAVEAGLGISIRTDLGIPANLQMLEKLPGTKRLPSVKLILLEGRTPVTVVTTRLKDALIQHLRSEKPRI